MKATSAGSGSGELAIRLDLHTHSEVVGAGTLIMVTLDVVELTLVELDPLAAVRVASVGLVPVVTPPRPGVARSDQVADRTISQGLTRNER